MGAITRGLEEIMMATSCYRVFRSGLEPCCVADSQRHGVVVHQPTRPGVLQTVFVHEELAAGAVDAREMDMNSR